MAAVFEFLWMGFEEQVFDSFDGVTGKESQRTLEFVKYHGIGNDFIMVSILWGFCCNVREPFLSRVFPGF